MINWNKYFDHIYVLSGCSNFEKRKQLEDEFNRIGLNNYQWWYNCNNYFLDKSKFWIYNDIHQNIAFGHYSIIKTCYELGYENILIMEDDIRFLKDINEIENQLNIFLENKNKYDCYYFDYLIIDESIYNFDCIYLNRKTMKYLIYCLEHFGLNMDMNMPIFYTNQNSYLNYWYYQDNKGNSCEISIPLELLPINVKLSPIRLCIENDNKIIDNIQDINIINKYNIKFYE